MRWLLMLSMSLVVLACKPRKESLRQRHGADEGASDSKRGDVGVMSAEGILKGWAVSPGHPKEIVTVRFFESVEAKTALGEVRADQVGFDNNVEGDHAFSWQVPQELCDGTNRQLHVRIVVGGKEEPLIEVGRTYSCYQSTAAGKEYFNTTLLPALKVCGECHQFTYEKAWGSLASPIPANGGSPKNNGFINAPAAETRHGGGKICSDIDTSPCKEIQEWWNKEFIKN